MSLEKCWRERGLSPVVAACSVFFCFLVIPTPHVELELAALRPTVADFSDPTSRVPRCKQRPSSFSEEQHHSACLLVLCEGPRFSAHSPAFGVVPTFYFNLSDRCVVIPHCGFNSHSPNGSRCRTSFHAVVCCVCVLSREKSLLSLK